MQEGQERDASAVEEAHVIHDDDDDDENSVADTPDLWMPERNEEDTKFVRGSGESIPTKKHPQTVTKSSPHDFVMLQGHRYLESPILGTWNPRSKSFWTRFCKT